MKIKPVVNRASRNANFYYNLFHPEYSRTRLNIGQLTSWEFLDCAGIRDAAIGHYGARSSDLLSR